MVDDVGREYALSRFILSKDVLAALSDGRFPQCLKELMSINHGCLRPVIDGGLDPVDYSPWLATYWWEGETLHDRIQDKELTQEDIRRVKEHAQSVISGVGQFASFLNFDPSKIVSVQGAEGNVVETFTIDLYQWFVSWATGRPPAPEREPNRQLAVLVDLMQNGVAVGPALGATPTLSLQGNPVATKAAVLSGSYSGGAVAQASSPTPIGNSSVNSSFQLASNRPKLGSGTHTKEVDPLAAYRKTTTKGQKAGVVATVLFILLAVVGIGFVILKDRKTALTKTSSSQEAPVASHSENSASILEALKEQGKKEGKVKPAYPLGSAVKRPPKAILLDEVTGDVIPYTEEHPVDTASLEVKPDPRPVLGKMAQIYATDEIDLNQYHQKWIILTGKVKSHDERGFILEGPNSIQGQFGAEAKGVTVTAGDLVEMIGWCAGDQVDPYILIQLKDDLDIIEK